MAFPGWMSRKRRRLFGIKGGWREADLLFKCIKGGHVPPPHEDANDLTGAQLSHHGAVIGQARRGMSVDFQDDVSGADAHILGLAAGGDPKHQDTLSSAGG